MKRRLAAAALVPTGLLVMTSTSHAAVNQPHSASAPDVTAAAFPTRPWGLASVDMLDPSDGWAVGWKEIDGAGEGGARAWTARWDGTEWRHVRCPNPRDHSAFNDVSAIAADDVWAVGVTQHGSVSTFLEHWDGTTWARTGPRLEDSYLASVSSLASDDVWAVGTGHGGVGLALHWNGVAWQHGVIEPPAGTTSMQLLGVSAVAADDVWAAGYVRLGGTPQLLLEHFDGLGWSSVDPPASATAGWFLSVSGSEPGDVWAVGRYLKSGHYKALTAHWDGSSWSLVHNPDVPQGPLNLVDVEAASPTNAWAIGSTSSVAEIPALFEHWDGSTWSLVDPPAQDTRFPDGLSVVGADDIWVVGQTGASRGFFANWDGSQWTVIP